VAETAVPESNTSISTPLLTVASLLKPEETLMTSVMGWSLQKWFQPRLTPAVDVRPSIKAHAAPSVKASDALSERFCGESFRNRLPQITETLNHAA
jgi:hypothetical protein